MIKSVYIKDLSINCKFKKSQRKQNINIYFMVRKYFINKPSPREKTKIMIEYRYKFALDDS
jgi:hypothetical protein